MAKSLASHLREREVQQFQVRQGLQDTEAFISYLGPGKGQFPELDKAVEIAQPLTGNMAPGEVQELELLESLQMLQTSVRHAAWCRFVLQHKATEFGQTFQV